MLYLRPLTMGVASLILLGVLYNASLRSSSTSIVSKFPSQSAGESLSTFLKQLFSDDMGSFAKNISVDGSNSKRGLDSVDTAAVGLATSPYSDSYGLHQSCWDEETDSGTVKYNISADFSSCSTGLRLNTDIGVYTFTNGTTSNNTQLCDMVYDLYPLRHSRTSPNPNYANHTAAVAQLASEEGNQLLESGLICRNNSPPTQTDLIINYQELRHLLGNKHSYWAAVLLSAAGGAILGGSIAAAVDKVSSGNVTAHNVIQTAFVVGSVVIISGILTRLDQVGKLDRAETVAHNVRELVPLPQGREAIVQNVYLAWVRTQIQRIVRRQVEETLSQHSIGSGSGSHAGSHSVTPGSAGSSAFGSCLSEMEAGEAAGALGDMTDVTLNLEPVQEVFELLGPRDEQGSCSSP